MYVRRMTINFLIGVFVAMMIMVSVGGVYAAYPEERPITVIVAYSVGGGTDTFIRFFQKYAEQSLGQKLVIKNLPGAGCQIGWTTLANARPDGYTIGIINLPSINILMAMRDNVGFEISNFKTICQNQADPMMLAVQPDSPFKNAAELVDYARSNPEKIVVGFDGPLSNNQLQWLAAAQKVGIETTNICYDGSGPTLTALLGGHIDAAVPSSSSALPYIESGKLRSIGVFASERLDPLPNVPTFSESTGITVPSVGLSCRGFAAPKGTPQEIIDFLEKAFKKALNDPVFLERAKKAGIPINYLGSKEFEEHFKSVDENTKLYAPLFK